MGLLNIEQKKGSPDNIDGRLTVYAIIDIDASETMSASHPIASMVHNGLLAAQGNYKEQSSLKDFLMSEMGESLEEGIEEFIDKLEGLEGALDPQKLKDKMKNLDDLKDFIPTPAKIVPFHSEEEILEQEGDVFYVGRFKNMANANLSINSFPIMYQARFREQEIDMIKNEIDQIISQIESNESNELPDSHHTSPDVNIEQKIIKDYIPVMLYSRKNENDFAGIVKKFKRFLSGYKFPEDVEKVVSVITGPEELTPSHYKLLELYAKKISGVCRENFSAVDKINKEISSVEEELSKN